MTSRWHQHPAFHDEERTFGQRAADQMRNGMGSWPFVFAFLFVMGVWMLVNSLFLSQGSNEGFDPYPYILLNLILSTMAGLQAAALLIAAKRSDHIASVIALHTEQNTERIKELLQKNTELTQIVHDHILATGQSTGSDHSR